MSSRANFWAFAATAVIATTIINNIFFISVFFICNRLYDSSFFTLHLELLSKYEMELASALYSIYLVETVCPVYTHQTNHREEDADTYTC